MLAQTWRTSSLEGTHALDPKWPLTAASLLIHCEESPALLVGELIVIDITAILSPYIVLWHRDRDERRAPYVRWRCGALAGITEESECLQRSVPLVNIFCENATRCRR